MAKAKKSKAKGGAIKVDFTGVEGKRTNLPDDDYLVEVEEIEVKDGNEHPYFEIQCTVQSGKFKGQKLWDRLSTSPGALWRLRSFLEVIGMEVPDDEMEIDKDEIVGTQFVAVTAQEKYKNDDGEKKVAVRVVDFYSADDFKEKDEDESDEDDDDDDKKSKSKKDKKKASKADKKSKKSKDDDDDGDDDADDDSDDDGDDDETPEERKKRERKERRAKRKAKAGDDDEDEKLSKKKSKKSKDEDDDDGDDDDSDDDDDGDDDDKKSKKSKGKSKGGKKVSADTVNDADEDDLEKIIKKAGLDVDLDDFKTLRKKQAAVIDALETAELLEEDDD